MGTDIEVTPSTVDRAREVLTPEALDFVADLQRRFGPVRDELLRRRYARREEIARTGTLDFPEETRSVREDPSWRVATAPADLADRRVEMTGPTERKMAINALNSGAKVWLADLEDANTPHWENVVAGQVNLRDAVRRTIAYTSPEGKEYALRDDAPLSVMVVRPRGWHLDERHVRVDGAPAVGALVDFGLYFHHNATELLERGSGPYFYLPKTESHREARLWNEIFTYAQERLGVPYGTVRATVLIETITAAFEMEEILYELRDHASGLNAGRWDYLFSVIKNFREAGQRFVLPDRNSVTMTAPFMRAYTELLVSTCHRRGAFAIGGMAAFIPSRRDPEVNARALAKVREDKEREARDGFDGSWVAHPDLVPVCQEVFDRVLGDRPNQLDRQRPDGGRPARGRPYRRPGHRGGRSQQRVRGAGLPVLVARRQRCGGHQQPDGGRGDRRDRAVADLAVDPQRGTPAGRPAGQRRAGTRPAGRGVRPAEQGVGGSGPRPP
jgi:malate synthase